MARSNGINRDGERKRGRLIPEGELPCIWMDAGLISYKLCDYEYECESCPFDAEMRRSGRTSGMVAQAVQPIAVEERRQMADEVMEECYYHSGHTWIKQEGSREDTRPRLRIGVDNFAAKILPRIKGTISPHRKSAIHQGQVFCWIVCGSNTLPLLAPISGEVVAVNPKLSVRPNLINTDPHGEGWIISVAPSDLEREMGTLLTGEVAASWMARDWKKFERRASLLQWPIDLSSKFHGGIDVGTTLADGGERLEDLFDDVRLKRYMEFIIQFFL